MLPDEHLLDAGYVDAEALISAKQDLGVTIISPVREKVSWQAKAAQGFDLVNFSIDWEKKIVTCPMGQTSAQWCERHTEGRKPAIQARFYPITCQACPSHLQCTRAKSGARTVTFLSQVQHSALQQARTEQNSLEFRIKYAQRAGIEGTISQGVRGFDLRYTRYIGAG